MYADTITESMQKTIDETYRRRTKQLKYNEKHHITPKQIVKDIKNALPTTKDIIAPSIQAPSNAYIYMEPDSAAFAADPIIERMSKEQLEKSIANTTALMKQAAKQLDFIQAAQYRDEIVRLKEQLNSK